jgi:hypothetical protein
MVARMESSEFFLVDANKTAGVVTQKGLLVLRPSYAVFVPTEAAINALGTIVGGLAAAGAGFILRVKPGQYPDVRAYLAALTAEPAAEFDAQVGAIAKDAGWWVGSPTDTSLLFAKVPLFKRYKLVLKRGKDTVAPTFGLAKELAARAEPLAARWSSPT